VFFDFSSGDTPFEKSQETTDTEELFFDSETDVLPVCAHGHIIGNPQELGGMCICGRPLCKDCASQRQGFIDGHILCKEDAGEIDGKIVGSDHGFFRLLWLALTGS
jgi:hypothetical protein